MGRWKVSVWTSWIEWNVAPFATSLRRLSLDLVCPVDRRGGYHTDSRVFPEHSGIFVQQAILGLQRVGSFFPRSGVDTPRLLSGSSTMHARIQYARLGWLMVAGAVLSLSSCHDVQKKQSEAVVAEKPTVTHAPSAPLEPFTQEIAGTSVQLQMIPIPAGDGIAPFYVSATEQTWDLYDVFIFNLDGSEGFSTPESDAVTKPSKPYVMADRGYGHQGYPSLSASPKAAEQFVKWISAKTARTYRLPTVAEQQHMLRNSGVTAENLEKFAWVKENSNWSPHPVGSLKADSLGLYDLWGNLAEYAVTAEGNYVVLGGSWIDPAAKVDMNYEIPFTPDWNKDDPQIPQSPWWLASNDWVGIRVVCEPQ